MKGDIITEQREEVKVDGRTLDVNRRLLLPVFLSAVNIVTSCNGYFATALEDAEN